MLSPNQDSPSCSPCPFPSSALVQTLQQKVYPSRVSQHVNILREIVPLHRYAEIGMLPDTRHVPVLLQTVHLPLLTVFEDPNELRLGLCRCCSARPVYRLH